jgi:hypothetical protein
MLVMLLVGKSRSTGVIWYGAAGVLVAVAAMTVISVLLLRARRVNHR